jgi:hypothetical protein
MMRIALAILVLWAGVSGALADGVVQKLMTANDKQRLAAYGETRKKAIAETRKGAANDVATLDQQLALPLRSFAGLDLRGKWQCRTIKLGGIGDLVIYDWFKCSVTDDGSGWRLEKLTGSQRTAGRFYDDGDKRMIYLGSLYIAGDQIKPYGSGPETDQVGYAFRTGAKTWRIELPAPYYESTLDIVEFRR